MHCGDQATGLAQGHCRQQLRTELFFSGLVSSVSSFAMNLSEEERTLLLPPSNVVWVSVT